MRLFTGIVTPWLGLCRKPPSVHALQTGFAIPPESTHEGLPDGGAGGSTGESDLPCLG